jgi:hypothetical protein
MLVLQNDTSEVKCLQPKDSTQRFGKSKAKGIPEENANTAGRGKMPKSHASSKLERKSNSTCNGSLDKCWLFK